MTRILSLFVVFMLTGALAFSQSRVVTGRVTTADGVAVPFASISINGLKNAGTVSDDNGAFSLKVKTGDILNISGNGVQSSKITVGEGNTANISLKRSNAELSTVVVTSLGQRTKAASIGYSVASIKTGELNQAKVVNLQNGLTGKVSGLNVQSVNSGVFGDTRITLRAIRSLTGNNQPLLVLDGIPVSLSQINNISPNDIADVSILKSNSAAALYGQDGSNGAIIVTTKKGSRSKPTINIGTTVQFEKLSFLPSLQHEYGPGETEGDGVTAYNGVIVPLGFPVYDAFTNNSFGPRYDGSRVKLVDVLEDGSQQYVDYKDLGNEKFNFFNTGVTVQNDISISGGDDKSRYYLSAQDANIKGTIPKDVNRRTSFRFNAGRDFGKLTTSFNTNYTLQNYSIVDQSRSQFDDIYTSVIKTAGHVPLTSYKDWKNNPFATVDGYYNAFGFNPYMLIDIDRQVGKRTNLIASTDLAYKFNSNFTFNYRLGTTVANTITKTNKGAITFSPYIKANGNKHGGASDNNGSVTDFSSNSTRISSDAFLTYTKTVGKLSIDALLGNSIIQREYKSINIFGDNLIVPGLNNVSNSTGKPELTELNYKIRTVGNYAKLDFGFDKKFYVGFTGRRDQDSRLPLNNNSFFYPSVNGAIIINELIPALKNSTKISLIKVRGTWAKSGNVNLGTSAADFEGAYQLTAGLNLTGQFPLTSTSYSVGDALKDPNIRPEFVVTKEVGLELGFLKNRISFEVTAFTQNNTDQVIDISLPTSTGFGTSKLNAASFVNRGIEFDLKLAPLVNLGKFRLDFKTNLTLSDSKVNSIYQDLKEVTIGNLNTVALGKPAYVLKLTDFKRAPDGRVIVDAVTGTPSADPSPKQFGNTLPKYILGVSPTLSYGGLSITAVIEARGGNFIYNDIGGDLVFNGIGKQTTNFNRQPFVWPNSVIDIGGGKYQDNTNITTKSGNASFWATSLFANNIQSLYYTSANFIKLREVSLSYNFPIELLGQQKTFKAASITFSGRNLLLFVPKSNQYTDPEFGNTTGNATGVNTTGQTPPTRVMGVTVNLTF
jgi:TonB-linked SusC/RagA family outer membrane protein